MTKEVSIIDLVKVIRSKNAGPFELTFDIIFKDKETYEKVKKTKVITKELIAKLYHVPIEKVLYFVEFDPANAIKATIVRPWWIREASERPMFMVLNNTPRF